MKKLFTLLPLFALFLMPFLSNAQGFNLVITDIVVSGTTITFDAYVHADPGTSFGINSSGFKIGFDDTQFTSPTLTKNAALTTNGLPTAGNSFVSTTWADPTAFNTSLNVQFNYYNNILPSIVGSELAIDINFIIPADVADYDARMAIIDDQTLTHRLGQFILSGYNGGDDGTLAALTCGNNIVQEMLRTDFSLVVVPATSCLVDLVLPVGLSSFTAQKANENDVQVKWATELEENMDEFILERSNDAENWTIINRQTAKGAGSAYSYYDNDVYRRGAVQSTFYYRLKSVDSDGAFIYSDLEVVDFNNDEGDLGDISIMPNPASNQISVLFHNDVKAEGTEYQITNMQGQLMTVGFIDETKTIETNFASGVYLIHFRKESANLFTTQRLVIID